MSTIPVSSLVNVLTSVLAAGGSAVNLTGLILSTYAGLPAAAPLGFVDAASVATYFGSSSDEAKMATVYFNGWDGSTKKPGQLIFSRYAASAISAFTRGAKNGLSLSQIQAITAGTLSVTIDGVVKSGVSINLSAASSFSNAAALLTTALTLSGGAAVTYDSTFGAFVITSGTTGATSTITYASGTIATSLSLLQSAGAVISQGKDADTPGGAMASIIAQTQNWVCFSSTFEPSLTDKESFATWVSSTAGRYCYCPWDTDATIVQTPGSYTGLMAYVRTNSLSGVCPWYADKLHAAFALGFAASIDFAALNGRAVIAYKTQAGLAPSITDGTSASNAEANGFNYYGAFATANQGFDFAFPGQISGAELFFDNYLDDVWMASSFQSDLINLLASQQTNSIPYNSDGYSLMRSAMMDTIQAALNFGAIRSGIPLTNSQAAQVNNQAGLPIDGYLSRQGWYLQIKDPSGTVRQQRGTPVCIFWYTNGESVQRVTLNSVNIL